MKGAIFVENLSFTKEEYLERLTNLLTKNIDEEISRIKKSRKKDDANYKKIIKKYNFDQRLQLLVEAVRNFIFLRTFTTEASDKLLFITRNTILEEAAKRLNLSSEEIVTLSSNEIVNLLTGNMQSAKSLINKRQRGYAIVWVNGNNFIKFGKEATKLQKSVSDRFKIKKDLAKKKAIKGTPASLGKVKGVVKVLSSHEEVGKVHKGDILVTSMTTPDYIFAMEKAAAFVTDEGGITCHAAIVAREFGVPCIVGTINTTKLLKDGNLVEVNANKGIVTILN
jgi:phosphoenolpyruvate synthase/pyruvate phosphate dikinase